MLYLNGITKNNEKENIKNKKMEKEDSFLEFNLSNIHSLFKTNKEKVSKRTIKLKNGSNDKIQSVILYFLF